MHPERCKFTENELHSQKVKLTLPILIYENYLSHRNKLKFYGKDMCRFSKQQFSQGKANLDAV